MYAFFLYCGNSSGIVNVAKKRKHYILHSGLDDKFENVLNLMIITKCAEVVEIINTNTLLMD